MTTPDYLKKGDRIRIVAPAGKLDRKTVESAKIHLEKWGLEVILSRHLFKDDFQYSANDLERTADFQQALNDPKTKAIFCARGGYGTLRIIDYLDFNPLDKEPKWIIGFSDITVIHAHIHTQFNIETIHGTMASGLTTDDHSARTLKEILFGDHLTYNLEFNALSRAGECNGELIGGNLAILNSLIGSNSDIQTEDKIVFIEEVGESLYRIDRMMWTLKRAGKLEHLAGLIVGGMTEIPDTKEDFGKTAYEIIQEHIQPYDYPVCFGFPAGHQKDNRAMIFGRNVSLKITHGKGTELNFSHALSKE